MLVATGLLIADFDDSRWTVARSEIPKPLSSKGNLFVWAVFDRATGFGCLRRFCLSTHSESFGVIRWPECDCVCARELVFVGREGQAAHPRAPGQCLHFECRGAPARVRAWRCEGRPPLPHHFVCVETFTLLGWGVL